MCRIAGIVAQRLNLEEDRIKVNLMCDAMKHGGPDDAGIFSAAEANLVFGHRRLSIIDLSSNGHQPMADIDKRAWITFNGEIYNYRELKSELINAGARFHSHTDTEVIIQAYLYWGTAAFKKLRGMFTFAIYDVTNVLTYLVRDTTGIKPLYYYINNGQLSFASEVKAFKTAGLAAEENQDWLIKFLAFGHVPEPDTVLKNVYGLPKGHFLRWNNKDGTAAILDYTKPVTNSAYITDIIEAKKQIDSALKMAIGRQLIADAPIGVFLSGGIDSSLLTLLAAQQKTEQLKTVSIFFDEKKYDESIYQQQILRKTKGEKFTHLVKQRDFDEFFPDVLNAMDMPTTDGINTWFISKYARQDGLKAVLSGIGADELFGGYPSFNRIKYIEYLRRVPAPLLKTISHFVTDPFKKLSFLTCRHPLADYLFLRGVFAPEDIAEILNCDEGQVQNTLFAKNDHLYPVAYNKEQASWFETNLYMQNQLLRDTDVMSMSHGLEVRVPFLDEDFQRIVNRLTPQIRFDDNQPKKILIDTFKDLLPAPVWNRPKMGFSLPLQQWMRNHAELSNEGLYRSRKAKRIIRGFKSNTIHWSKAFALYQIQMHA
ncbi:asparagine synthase (glutamine-hydrolyzing) [Mucilaginibacter sp. UR6-11]|uniref:asparagine synthase (glutamine-hydrolyzing) n=1 Tax=Mucilaginibacter sp. UR6-11 TaxID=1435644 RepID=UPI001E5AE8A8|nr:asparagine synthase (glutamine-hydrolyzing) [Mucilaginibacter sp. UR6-11]MCC8425716.1 asparagine synthase (glutamine-hydrolyzing) [Mucilaginibacter sp. UR6-11]